MTKIYLQLSKEGNVKRHFPFFNISMKKIYKYLENDYYSSITQIDNNIIIKTDNPKYILTILKKNKFVYNIESLDDVNNIIDSLNTTKNSENNKIELIRDAIQLALPLIKDITPRNISINNIINYVYDSITRHGGYYINDKCSSNMSIYYINSTLFYNYSMPIEIPINKYKEIIYLFMSINLKNNFTDLTREELKILNNSITKIL